MSLQIEPQEQKILDSVNIPPRPKALLTVMEESKKSEPSFAVIAKAIVADVSISATVLQIVNSPAFRRAATIASIDQALSLLGLKRVISIVNAVSVKSATQSNVDMESFWDNATVIANACVIVANNLKLRALVDDVYTLGLFHNAGVPIMASKFPDYMDFFQMAHEEGWAFNIVKEKEKYQTTHTTIGALMAQSWTLPDELVNVIYNLHYADGIFLSDDLCESSKKQLAILKMAREIGRFYGGETESSAEWLEVEGQIIQFLELPSDQFEVIKEEVIASLEA
ncbi:MAG: HDOD domain-containing protein [Pseudomonadota bacterium]